MKLTIIFILIPALTSLFVSSAIAGMLGNADELTTNNYPLSYWFSSVKYERCVGNLFTADCNASVTNVKAYLKRYYATEEAKAVIYLGSDASLYATSSEQSISSTTYTWYTFTFPFAVYLSKDVSYYITIYADAPNSDPLTTRYYVYMAYLVVDVTTKYYTDNVQNYGTPDATYDYREYGSDRFCLYLTYSVMDYKLLMRENLNSYLTGTHQYLYNSSTYKLMVWANYSGADISKHEDLNSYVTGTHESVYTSGTNVWNVYANYSGPDALIITSGMDEINYSAKCLYVPGVRWNMYINGSANINLINNTVNSTLTHEKKFNLSKEALSGKLILHFGNWSVWANSTGNTTQINKYENIVNATGFHNYTLNSSGYNVWANYTGNNTPITLYENIVNATGTHEYFLNSFGYHVYANITGNTSSVPGGFWHMFLNLSGVIGFINWTGDLSSNDTNVSFNVSSNMSIQCNADANTSESFLYYSSFDISQSFLLLSIFFGLLYFWWKSEKESMMYMLAFIIVPYDFVVVVLYALPLYITDANILSFVRVIFIIISFVVLGFTVDAWSKKREEASAKKQ